MLLDNHYVVIKIIKTKSLGCKFELPIFLKLARNQPSVRNSHLNRRQLIVPFTMIFLIFVDEKKR